MIVYHPETELMAGTDWTIAGTLTDANGQPFDVTDKELFWLLLSPDGVLVPVNAEIDNIDAPNGKIQIKVSNLDTVLEPGRYTDALAVGPDVFWMGLIPVAANPFLAAQGY